MAIEDGYELALTLSEAASDTPAGREMDIEAALKSYQSVRTQHLTRAKGTPVSHL